MKARLIDAAAFLVGAFVAFAQTGLSGEMPWPIRLLLNVLCPGYLVGLPLLYLIGAMGLASLGFFFLLGMLVNGLVFGLASYLIRKTMHGERLARLVLTLGMSLWIGWGTVSTFGAWPWPERPAPVDLSSPLAGRWRGVLHGKRGDRSIVLVCHPHPDSTLDGYLYVHGWDMGPFENGVYAGDSLYFENTSYYHSAHFDRTKMAMVTTVSNLRSEAELQFVSADTSRPPPAPVDLTLPPAGRWDGVLTTARGDYPVVLVCHPHADQVLEGYLYIHGMGMGRFGGGTWPADSVHFELDNFRYNARFDSTTMTMGRTGRGLEQSMALRFVTADTSRPAIPPASVRFP